jgi:transposase-like protein
MLSFKGIRFRTDVVLLCIRWYAAHPLSYRHIEEMLDERGVSVDHSTITRWAVRFLRLIEELSRKHKRPVGKSWRMDETYIKVKGVWKYLYCAVDKEDKTVVQGAPGGMGDGTVFGDVTAQPYKLVIGATANTPPIYLAIVITSGY